MADPVRCRSITQLWRTRGPGTPGLSSLCFLPPSRLVQIDQQSILRYKQLLAHCGDFIKRDSLARIAGQLAYVCITSIGGSGLTVDPLIYISRIQNAQVKSNKLLGFANPWSSPFPAISVVSCTTIVSIVHPKEYHQDRSICGSRDQCLRIRHPHAR